MIVHLTVLETGAFSNLSYDPKIVTERSYARYTPDELTGH